MRSQLLRLAEQMPTGYADRSTLIRNLKSSDGKTNIGLTNFAINALDAGSGYIYGAYGQDVTMAFLKQQQSRFFTDSDANLTNSEVNFIYETYGGKPAFDCIGLMNGLMKTLALSVTNPMVSAMSAQTECSAALSFSVRFPLSPIHPVWPFV